MMLAAQPGAACCPALPSLVLVHAFPLGRRMWRPQFNGLGRQWPVLAVDLRGLGDSPGMTDEPADLGLLADDIAETLTALRVGPVVACGLSMGGYVVMALARRHPDLLSGLVLADTRHGADTPLRRAGRTELADRVRRENSVRAIVDDLAPGFVGATTHARRPQVVAEVARLVRAAPPRTVAWLLEAMAARPDSAPVMRSLTVPTLVIGGMEDLTCPPALAQQTAGLIRDCQTYWVPEAGHLSSLENPAAFDAAVVSWLRAHWPGRDSSDPPACYA